MTSVEAAKDKLKKGFFVKDASGGKARFTKFIVAKYAKGKDRRKGADPERLRHLSRAIIAVEKANRGVKMHPHDNPPQKSYLHDFGKGRSVIVFTNAKTGIVRGFIYSSRGKGYLEKMHTKNTQ